MVSTACACTNGPNSSAAIGVAAMSDVPSAVTPISTVFPANSLGPIRLSLSSRSQRK
jgi:hypothetical protein